MLSRDPRQDEPESTPCSPGWGAYCAAVLFGGVMLVVLIVMLANTRKPAVPTLIGPIPAHTRDYFLSESAALRKVADKVDTKAITPDLKSLTAAIGAERRPANDSLAADVMAGDVSANLRAVADAWDALARPK